MSDFFASSTYGWFGTKVHSQGSGRCGEESSYQMLPMAHQPRNKITIVPAGSGFQMKDKDIFVTRPFLPPLEEFVSQLEVIWQTKRLTNNGPYHHQLENQLREFLGVEQISLFNNGTTALLCALQALDISGEVITTPYSFVATSHALLWKNIKPVFVDLEKDSFNLDPDRVEEAITPETTAILPVHCYGYPCDHEKLSAIAEKHNLKLLYDAAHGFGVSCRGESILKRGDLSVISFHSTKSFHTFEGGAIVSSDPEMKKKIDYLKNFGFDNETTVVLAGINGKMSEINAALGVLNLNHYPAARERKKAAYHLYCTRIKHLKGIRYLPFPESVTHNYHYFPILVGEDYPLTRDQLYDRFVKDNIFVRRYFFPLISHMEMYKFLPSALPDNLPNAESISREILCLPLYDEIDEQSIDQVIALLTQPY